MKRIICFGPGPQFKGGISNYNTALAKSLAQLPDTEVQIVSWIQQYPAIVPRDFIDRASRKDLLEGYNVPVTYLLDYNKPGTWAETYRFIRDQKPDQVIIQWAIALQGLPLGWLVRKLKQHPEIEVVFDVHVVVQKESSLLDKRFCAYGLSQADTFIVHAWKTAEELKAIFPKLESVSTETGERAPEGKKTIIKLFHPVYDLFKPDPNFDVAAEKTKFGLQPHVFLFFGFIRKYKGLHNVIPAFAEVLKQRQDVSLFIVGESFWQTLDPKSFGAKVKNFLFGAAKSIFLRKSDDERTYNPLELIDQLGIRDHVAVVNSFVPNEEVYRYFQVSDAILTYYLTATPSGVESLAYNFHMPVLATNVGHFPETVTPGFNGYLAEPENIASMAEVMLTFLDKPILRENVAKSAEHMSWARYAKAVSGRLNDA